MLVIWVWPLLWCWECDHRVWCGVSLPRPPHWPLPSSNTTYNQHQEPGPGLGSTRRVMMMQNTTLCWQHQTLCLHIVYSWWNIKEEDVSSPKADMLSPASDELCWLAVSGVRTGPRHWSPSPAPVTLWHQPGQQAPPGEAGPAHHVAHHCLQFQQKMDEVVLEVGHLPGLQWNFNNDGLN